MVRQMMKIPKLSKAQYRFFASVVKTVSEGIILGASAAAFLPETFQLVSPISVDRYLRIIFLVLLFLVIGAILERKGEE